MRYEFFIKHLEGSFELSLLASKASKFKELEWCGGIEDTKSILYSNIEFWTLFDINSFLVKSVSIIRSG